MAMKSKVVVKDLCNPKKVSSNMAENVGSVIVGTIYGTCSDINVRASADGLKEYEGLKGTFEAVPADKAIEPTQSSICYLPEFAQPLVRDVVMALDGDGNRINKAVKFGFEVSIERATNPQGYSWALRPIAKPVADDPLDVLRQEFAPHLAAPRPQAALEAPKATATPAAPGPKVVAGTAARK